MSDILVEIERPFGRAGRSTIVVRDNGEDYYVDTSNTNDHGWETMIFPYDMEKKVVTSWNELYVETYTNRTMALKKHAEIVSDLGKIFPDRKTAE